MILPRAPSDQGVQPAFMTGLVPRWYAAADPHFHDEAAWCLHVGSKSALYKYTGEVSPQESLTTSKLLRTTQTSCIFIMLRPLIILLVSSCTSQLVLASQPRDNQVFLAPIASHEAPPNAVHIVEDKIIAALKTHPDPVTALLLLQPELAADLAQPRLLQTFGDEEPKWMTEGDKLRLRRQGKKFVDITDHENFYAQEVNALVGKASERINS